MLPPVFRRRYEGSPAATSRRFWSGVKSPQRRLLLTAYAVRGLDINSSYTIYDLINKQKQEGVAVIYVGEDLDVLLELSDRILVLCGGKVSGIVPGRGASKREVGLMMTKLGGKIDE